MEQRRSERFPAELRVDLIQGKSVSRVRSLDVSRHGLLLETSHQIPEERFLIQLVIHLPGGTQLPANAFVARTLRSPTGEAKGVGVQLFALSASAKTQWDNFVQQCSGRSRLPGSSAGGLAAGPPDKATFLVKLRDRARLLEMYEKNVTRGGLYMATPVLKEQGAEVALIIIHPDTEEEYVLMGTVQRVCMEAPKGMEIKLAPLTLTELTRFRMFAMTGRGPEAPVVAPGAAHVASVETTPRTQVAAELRSAPTMPPRMPPPRSPNLASVPDLPIEAPVEAPLPRTFDRLPPAFDPAGDISIDIVVDESLLQKSEQFGWDDVHRDFMVVDFELADGDPPLDSKSTHDITTDFTLPPRSHRLRWPRLAPDQIGPPEVEVTVRCKACGHEAGRVRVGKIEGEMGLVAVRRPYWCPAEEKLVGVPRLRAAGERRVLLRQLNDSALSEATTVARLFEVAELSSSPQCPSCGGTVRMSNFARGMQRAVSDLETADAAEVRGAACSLCGEEALEAQVTATGDLVGGVRGPAQG